MSFSLPAPANRVGNTLTDLMFGSGFEARELNLDANGPVASVIESLDVRYLRYPGGTHTETFFDPSDPNNEMPTSFVDPSSTETFESISDFISFASANNISGVFVLPTARYFNPATEGALSLADANEIKTFVTNLLSGVYGPVSVHAFEIGNEWFDDRWAAPGGWTPAQFGKLQADIVKAVNEAIEAYQSSHPNTPVPEAPEIWVQGPSDGTRDRDTNGIRDSAEIREALINGGVLGYVDGVVGHLYQPIRHDNPITVFTEDGGELLASRRVDFLVDDGWLVSGSNPPIDIVITEWNIRAERSNDDDGGTLRITGLERVPLVLALFSDMAAAGVDAAMVYTAQGLNINGGFGTLSQRGDFTLTPTGLLFRMMRDSLPGTRLVDPDGNGSPEVNEVLFNDTSGNAAGFTYTYASADENKIVVYYANGTGQQISLTASGFQALIGAGYHVHATVLGAVTGQDPLVVGVDGQLQALTLAALDGASADGDFQLVLDAFELIQIVFTRSDGVVLAGDDQNTVADSLVGSGFADQLSGFSGNDTLSGLDGNDTLNGGLGADTMVGGLGNDTYVTDGGDTITEEANAGTDLVQSSVSLTLGANLENLTLTGSAAINATGNILANQLTGNAANNVLIGGVGADTLDGGAGTADLAAYWDSATGLRVDLQVTANNTGIALGDTFSGIENLAGTNLNDTLNGDSGNNVIIGFNGSDVIESRAGNDTLDGGEGNDTIGGGLGADSLLGGNGRDLAFFWDSTAAGVTARLDILGGNTGFATGDVFNGIEDIAGTNFADVLVGDATGNTLLGSGGNDTLFGNAGNDTLQGGAGNDSIYGMAGNDLLAGEAGQDSFVFEGSMGATNVDRIIDFSSVDDTIVLENALFTTLANGNLAANQVAFGAAASLGTHRVIYNSATGQLFYDADGLGGTAQVHLATLNPGVVLALADFFVI